MKLGAGLEKMLMQQVQKLQADAQKMKEELGEVRLEASAGGGMVKVVANGLGDLLEVKIEPEVVDPTDVAMLQDLVLAAVREALEKSRELQAEKTGALTGGLGLPNLF